MQPQPVTADHFIHYQWPTSLKGSPTGGLCWLQKRASLAKNRYEADLYTLHKGLPLRLTAGVPCTGYWWYGDVIVFAALREEADRARAAKGFPLTVLYTVSTVLPGEPVEWLRLDYEISDLAFLPGGRFLFTACYDAAREQLLQRAVNEDEAAEALALARQAEVLDELPFWADGEGFTSGKRQRLYLYDDGTVTPLTDPLTSVDQLRLSPTGKNAFFTANRYEGCREPADRLVRLDTASLALEDVTFKAPLRHDAFVVYDDDTLLVFGTDMKEYGLNQNGCFYRYDLPAKTLRTLDDSGDHCGYNAALGDLALCAEARWAESAAGAYWVDTEGANSHLMHIGLEGGITRVTHQPGAVLELAAAGDRLYITAMRGVAGPEVYSVDTDGNETRVTDLNTRLHKEYALRLPQPLPFANSEGNTIEGWVLYPAGFDEGGSYPAVLMIHGGPKMVYGTTAFHEMQLLSSEGFAVLYCNPTGSNGRGNEFGDIRGRWGLIDYDDLMAFVDTALEAHHWIDPAHLAVSGGSYGGHMVNWVIGHTGRFAAAVSQRGISNWASMQSLSDIGWQFGPNETGSDLWEDAAALWEQSPLRYAPRVATPTLFLHGEQDYRCPVGESLQMYSALRRNGVESRMVLFPGEGHGLATGRPQARIRRLQEIAAWLHKYLDSPAEEPLPEATPEPPAAEEPEPAPTPPKPKLTGTSLFELESELRRKSGK